MPQLAVVMIFLAAMTGLVLLSWAALDRSEEEQSREPDDPGELEPAQITA
jgi:hypothetical protein